MERSSEHEQRYNDDPAVASETCLPYLVALGLLSALGLPHRQNAQSYVLHDPFLSFVSLSPVHSDSLYTAWIALCDENTCTTLVRKDCRMEEEEGAKTSTCL
jgi:hypothetical protein